MDVSIIILSYNTRDLLRRCVQTTLAHQDGLSCEVIVVDNASSDGSEEMTRAEFPAVQVVQTGRNLGYAGGNNAGIRVSRAEFVLLLNSDAFLADGALRGMVEHMRSHPRAGIVGPRLAHEDGSLHLSCRRFPSLGRHFAWVTGMQRILPIRWAREWDWLVDFAHDEPRQVEMLSGACWMLRREMLDEIGLLNEDLFLYGEEFDLCRRAAVAGWQRWFVPAGPVVHAGGRSTPGGPATGVLTSFHRYRSGYLTMRWHRGLSQAVLTAGMDQAVLHWRLWKNRFLHPNRAATTRALAEAIENSRQAAVEMICWRKRPEHVN